MSFPADFTWGAGTSAYQIEGAWDADGKGESIWDRFAHEGRMPVPGDVACDHYHRWEEDLDLLARMGATAYRFSIAWTRILPDGTGEVNPAGIGFYDRLVDGLLARGITPWVTLYHWDLPQALQDRGGWPERTTVDAFLCYAEVVSRALGDRVRHWITHNEPWVAAFLGHREGIFAPGLQDWEAALAAAHHLLLSHGHAVPIIRANSPEAHVGIALDCRPASPASPDPADVAVYRHFDGFRNRWFFDPVMGKGYPGDMVAAYRDRGRFGESGPSFIHSGDLDDIAAPIDFLGINYYTSLVFGDGDDPESEETGIAPGPDAPDGYTEMGWPITPQGLTDYLQRVVTDYRPAAIVITENGASYSDEPNASGTIADARRIDYLRRHLAAVEAAIDSGVPVTGYFAWSLLDNLEWTSGFSQRFGLVWVDHATGERIPKQSFDWYAGVIDRNGLAG
jgi:beta-glucosidase